QKKFWPLYNVLFQQQARLLRGDLLSLAKSVGINPDWLAGELDRKSFRRRVMVHRYQARSMRIRGVPSLFVNGKRIPIRNATQLKIEIQYELWKCGKPPPQATRRRE
ncbi:MAG: DsbA family protein, partial [Myxococcota bacterium]